jgi:hypothetical protein
MIHLWGLPVWENWLELFGSIGGLGLFVHLVVKIHKHIDHEEKHEASVDAHNASVDEHNRLMRSHIKL